MEQKRASRCGTAYQRRLRLSPQTLQTYQHVRGSPSTELFDNSDQNPEFMASMEEIQNLDILLNAVMKTEQERLISSYQSCPLQHAIRPETLETKHKCFRHLAEMEQRYFRVKERIRKTQICLFLLP